MTDRQSGQLRRLEAPNFSWVRIHNVQQQWLKGELSARKAAKILGVSHVTFINWAKKNL